MSQNDLQIDSQSTTDSIEPTQLYRETMCRAERFNLENWPHDRQPNASQYSDSDVSMVPCSLGVPLTQESEYVPETPESTQPSNEELIKKMTAYFELNGYTSFTHKTKFGGATRTMHLAFRMDYEEGND